MTLNDACLPVHALVFSPPTEHRLDPEISSAQQDMTNAMGCSFWDWLAKACDFCLDEFSIAFSACLLWGSKKQVGKVPMAKKKTKQNLRVTSGQQPSKELRCSIHNKLTPANSHREFGGRSFFGWGIRRDHSPTDTLLQQRDPAVQDPTQLCPEPWPP